MGVYIPNVSVNEIMNRTTGFWIVQNDDGTSYLIFEVSDGQGKVLKREIPVDKEL